MQKTLSKAFTIKGIGLHSGREFTAVVSPAPENTGIQFRRDDVRIPVLLLIMFLLLSLPQLLTAAGFLSAQLSIFLVHFMGLVLTMLMFLFQERKCLY